MADEPSPHRQFLTVDRAHHFIRLLGWSSSDVADTDGTWAAELNVGNHRGWATAIPDRTDQPGADETKQDNHARRFGNFDV
jgi:hypothetical protein